VQKEITKHDVQMEDRYIRRKCPNHTARYSNILTTVSAPSGMLVNEGEEPTNRTCLEREEGSGNRNESDGDLW
jgi:hypothetical protein